LPGSPVRKDADALAGQARAHAVVARDLGLPSPITRDYVDRQRQIALWRKTDPEKLRENSPRTWDPVAAIDGRASAHDNSVISTDDMILLSRSAPAFRGPLAPDTLKILEEADLVQQINRAAGSEQLDLQLRLAGIRGAINAPMVGEPTLPLQEVP